MGHSDTVSRREIPESKLSDGQSALEHILVEVSHRGATPPVGAPPCRDAISGQHLLVAPVAQASLREVIVVAGDHTVVSTPGVACRMAYEQRCARHGHGMGTAWARHGHGMGTACAHERAAVGAPGRVERYEGAEQSVLCGRQLVGGTEEARGELAHEDIAPRLGGQNAKGSAALALP